jgi:hypothetical protein
MRKCREKAEDRVTWVTPGRRWGQPAPPPRRHAVPRCRLGPGGRSMALSGSIGLFVAGLLKQIHPSANLASCIDWPPEHYTLRIEIPNESGKSLILSKRLVEAALTRPAALQSLRLILRSEVLKQRAQQAVAAARSRRAEVQMTMLGICSACSRPITVQERAVVRRAQILHRGCVSARSA